MKELSIEEKARAYDKAIKKIKYVMEHGVQPVLTKEDLQSIFLEIFESEDERIRKAIITFFESEDDNTTYALVPKKDILAWLEKQGQVNETIIPQHEDKTCKEKVDNANKAEPKFRVGDFVCNKNGKIAHVEDIKVDSYGTLRYYVRWSNGNKSDPMPCFFDENHLWTIHDAKDGDVLASGHLVFIFKVIHGVWLNCHCSAHNDGSFIADSYDLMTNKYFSEVHPATKEQHTELFQKIKEAGYEWDDGKKELRKILKLSNSAKTCENDTLLDLLQKMPSCITVDGIDYHFVMKKTSIYIAYYACYKGNGEEGRCNGIFGITAHSPIDLLTEMLEKLKEEGLL